MNEFVQLKDTKLGKDLAKLRIAIQQEIIPAVTKQIEALAKQAESLVKLAELANEMQHPKEEPANPPSK